MGATEAAGCSCLDNCIYMRNCMKEMNKVFVTSDLEYLHKLHLRHMRVCVCGCANIFPIVDLEHIK